MATTIDNIASSDPHRPWISIPRDDDDLTKGFIDITFKQFANGINHAAAWLESCLGPTTGSFDIFAYEGPKDSRAYIITVAAVKVGRKILLPFPLVPDHAKLHNDQSSRAFQSVLGGRPHVSSALVDQILRHGQIEGIVSSPSVIRDFSRDPEMLRRLQSMKSISWAGGPLEKATGDVLCRHAKLSSTFGSAELGPLLTRVGADPADWDYIWFVEGQGIEFDKCSEKLFERVIRRDKSARFQQIFFLHPELEEYYTKDLFERHPTKKDMWRYSGRKDDMEMEQVIMRHPAVQWALIGVDGRNRRCLLLQLADDVATSAEERDVLISSGWPAVEAANSVCSEFVRLTNELTIFSDLARPFRRSGKDSLLRETHWHYTRMILIPCICVSTLAMSLC